MTQYYADSLCALWEDVVQTLINRTQSRHGEDVALGLSPRILSPPIVSIVVPFSFITISILRIPNNNPKKELQRRL